MHKTKHAYIKKNQKTCASLTYQAMLTDIWLRTHVEKGDNNVKSHKY